MAIKTILQSKISGGDERSDAILHSAAISVDEVTEEVRQVIQDLKDTLQAYPFCVGLSAPQIGQPYAISVVNVTKESPEKNQVLINPTIVSLSGKKDRKRESCMSVWGEMGEVERRDKLVLEYRDEMFNMQRGAYTGFESRVIQHELDHLSGILYSDRLIQDTSLEHADFFDEYSVIEG